MEELDDLDRTILSRLGYAVARAQLWEFAMLKLLESQRHELEMPFADRWLEIERWLTKWPAGRIAHELHVPEAVAADLTAIVARRNLVAHHAWRFYLAGREKRGDRAVAAHAAWLDEQAAAMGRAYNGIMALVAKTREEGQADEDGVLAVWRRHVHEPVSHPQPPEHVAGD